MTWPRYSLRFVLLLAIPVSVFGGLLSYAVRTLGPVPAVVLILAALNLGLFCLLLVQQVVLPVVSLACEIARWLIGVLRARRAG